MRRRHWLTAAAVVALLLGVAWTAPFPHARDEAPHVLLAHRGVHHTFSPWGVNDETCTARRIDPPTHAFIENTIPAIEAAFAAGASAVEMDVQRTADGELVLFHDWTLDCRTDGKGVTEQQTLADLRTLDVGWGYTADDGATWPLRGTGRGMIPTLGEVLARFPQHKLLLHQKSSKVDVSRAIGRFIGALPPERQRFIAYDGVHPELVRDEAPHLGATFAARGRLKSCVLHYMARFGTELGPACAGETIVVPEPAGLLVPGWPDRLATRARAREVRVLASYVDDPDDAIDVARGPVHGIATDRIEIVGPALREQTVRAIEPASVPWR